LCWFDIPSHTQNPASIQFACVETLVFKGDTLHFRSHRVILEVPSQQFYAGALEERADRRHTEYLAGWERMPRTPRGDVFPLMIVGKQSRVQCVCTLCCEATLQ
jgi:hypothetical protein